MIKCAKCGKDNQDHYKYCLGCGAELPANAQAYVRRLEELSGARISVIGVGPGRDENVVVHDLLD